MQPPHKNYATGGNPEAAVVGAIPTTGRCTCEGTVPIARAYHEPDCPDASDYDLRGVITTLRVALRLAWKGVKERDAEVRRLRSILDHHGIEHQGAPEPKVEG